MDELIIALNTIKEECKSHSDCYKECPLANGKGICLVKSDRPDRWDIKAPFAIPRVME